jgi:hypothetical protein
MFNGLEKSGSAVERAKDVNSCRKRQELPVLISA